MKPAIILFTTITFVISITLLIMQMINNNEKLLTVDNKSTLDIQALLIINDLKREIGKLLINKKNEVYEVIGKDTFIEYKDIRVKFVIDEFVNPFNINNILKSKNETLLKKYFEENDLDFNEFKFFIRDYFSNYDIKKIKISRNSQVEKILFKFNEFTSLKNANKLIEKFTYFDIEKKDQYFLCKLYINIDGEAYRSSFIYNLKELNKKNIKVRDFEITVSQ